MKSKVIAAIYFLTGMIYIFLDEKSLFQARYLIKWSLIPLMIIMFTVNLRKDLKGLNLFLFSGLIASWAGDIAIDYSFVAGLAFFLLAQVFYSFAFFLAPGMNILIKEKPYLLLPVLLYGFALMIFIYKDLGAMRIPVIIYAAVILLMLTGAVNRLRKTNRRSYIYVLAGAVLFVISDSAIAVNKFSLDFNHSDLVIMATYITAQYLITAGYILHAREQLA